MMDTACSIGSPSPMITARLTACTAVGELLTIFSAMRNNLAMSSAVNPGAKLVSYCESFNARFRDELLNGEIFYSLREAQIIIERWRRHYNTVRTHSAIGYRPPAPESIIPMDQRPLMH